MWLLSSDRAELSHFPDHTSVEGGYAILSHTWGDKEQTYQELRAIEEECRKTGKNPRNHVSEKIRGSCILAEKHGYQWIWIDSCCIEKTSSSELSEAINSMFTWYADSEVCYAYLEDVPGDCIPEAPHSPFRKARWHTRGWTLQELIAPSLVVFVSKDWGILGTKNKFAKLLAEITGIAYKIFTFELRCSAVSIAQRMRWASKRTTTRLEDEAYCLIGLFEVNIPTIYGEGRRAFQRLQEELMKRTFDTSLFAWGLELRSSHTYVPLAHDHLSIHPSMRLLASSPADFKTSYFYSPRLNDPLQPYLPWQLKRTKQQHESEGQVATHSAPFGDLDLPRFTQSSYGVECRFPVFQVDDVTVAILLCDDRRSHIGLILHRSPVNIQAPTRALYRAGYMFTADDGRRFTFRLAALGVDYNNIRFRGKPVTVEWRDICIDYQNTLEERHRNGVEGMIGGLKGLGNNMLPETSFRIPRWLISQLTRLDFDFRSFPSLERFKQGDSGGLSSYIVGVSRTTESVHFVLGICTKRFGQNGEETVSHWATVDIRHDATYYETRHWSHDCSRDHIKMWPQWTKEFHDIDRIVRLSFTPCQVTPAMTLVMHVELDGDAYKHLSQTKNAPLPSFTRSARWGMPAFKSSRTSTILAAPSASEAPTPPHSSNLSSQGGAAQDLKDMAVRTSESDASISEPLPL